MEVALIMGSKSDDAIMKEAAKILKQFNVSFEKKVVSAHRTPKAMFDYASDLSDRGFKVVIAAAGGAAHLPGMVAAITSLPVIGVPIKTKTMNGIDSLYSIVQMPKGIPVMTMAINGAENAAYSAIAILALENEELSRAYREYKEELASRTWKEQFDD